MDMVLITQIEGNTRLPMIFDQFLLKQPMKHPPSLHRRHTSPPPQRREDFENTAMSKILWRRRL
jgi:hypothetical protein